MKSILATSLSLVLLAMPAAALVTAEEFFHVGASNYLASKIEPALMAVTNGLRLDPQNLKLKKLEELLRQQQQQQQNQDQQNKDKEDQQKKDDQQKQDQQKKDQEKKQEEQQKKDSQQSKDEEQKKQEEQSKKDQEKRDEQDKKASANKDKKEEGKEDEAQPAGQAAMKMTPQEAMRFLEVLKSTEQAMPFKPPTRTNRQPDRVLKDW